MRLLARRLTHRVHWLTHPADRQYKFAHTYVQTSIFLHKFARTYVCTSIFLHKFARTYVHTYIFCTNSLVHTYVRAFSVQIRPTDRCSPTFAHEKVVWFHSFVCYIGGNCVEGSGNVRAVCMYVHTYTQKTSHVAERTLDTKGQSCKISERERAFWPPPSFALVKRENTKS